MVAFNCGLSGVSDLLHVSWRQELVVLRVKQMQELGCLSACHHSVRLFIHKIGLLENVRYKLLVTTRFIL
jgi:hypothetical protein